MPPTSLCLRDLAEGEARLVSSRRHLSAAAISFFIVVLAIGLGGAWATALEKKQFRALLPIFTDPKGRPKESPSGNDQFEQLKNQGIVIQQRAFKERDEFPLYGSSELVKAIPDKASYFFRSFPTGFAVFPVGKAGSTPLIVLQRLAALGRVTKGKRVAIILSPTWFFRRQTEGEYEGNFSHPQALAALLNTRLSFTFRCQLARALLQHRSVLQQDGLLRFLSLRMAHGTRSDRAWFNLAWPLARLRTAIQSWQDHFESAFVIGRKLVLGPLDPPPPQTAKPDWERLIAEATTSAVYFQRRDKPMAAGLRKTAANKAFREAVAQSPEWHDLDLLARGLHEMGLAPLILCVPPDGNHLEQGGVSRRALERLTRRIRFSAGRCGATVETFDDHIDDLAFHADDHDHLSTRGWMYFNRSLDRFFHADPMAAGRAKPGVPASMKRS